MTLSLQRRYRLLAALFCCAGPVLLVGVPLIGSPTEARLWGLQWWMMALAGIVIFAMLAAYQLLSSYHVTLGEKGLSVGRVPTRFQKPACLDYENVARVSRGGMRGLVRLTSRRSDAVQIDASVLQGGPERLLAELERRLPAGVIEADLPRRVRAYQRSEVLTILLGVGAWSLVLVMVFLTGDGYNTLRKWVGWRWDARLGRQTAWSAFALDPEGNPWLSIHHWPLSERFIAHLLPDELQLFSLPAGPTASQFPHSLGYDAAGHPWAIFDHEVLHWSEGEWHSLPLPVGGFSIVLWDPSSGALAVNHQNPRLDANSLYEVSWENGSLQPIPLPSGVEINGNFFWQAHLLPDQTMLGYFRTEGAQRVYIFRQGSWQEEGYALTAPPDGYIQDVTQDSQGTLWAVAENRDGHLYVGRFAPQAGQGSWFSAGFCCGQVQYARGIEVDRRGRIWISAVAKTALSDFLPFTAIYRFDGKEALEFVLYYSDANSGYGDGVNDLLYAGVDGRFWNGAAWIDTDAERLPPPLPEWLLPLRNKRVFWFTATLAILLVTLLDRGRTRQYIPHA